MVGRLITLAGLRRGEFEGGSADGVGHRPHIVENGACLRCGQASVDLVEAPIAVSVPGNRTR